MGAHVNSGWAPSHRFMFRPQDRMAPFCLAPQDRMQWDTKHQRVARWDVVRQYVRRCHTVYYSTTSYSSMLACSKVWKHLVAIWNLHSFQTLQEITTATINQMQQILVILPQAAPFTNLCKLWTSFAKLIFNIFTLPFAWGHIYQPRLQHKAKKNSFNMSNTEVGAACYRRITSSSNELRVWKNLSLSIQTLLVLPEVTNYRFFKKTSPKAKCTPSPRLKDIVLLHVHLKSHFADMVMFTLEAVLQTF